MRRPSTKRLNLHKTFSQAAYRHHLDKAQADIAGTGYTIDKSKSGREHKVFVNPKKKDVVIAYRGTDFSDKRKWFKDMLSDAAILTGTQRYNRRFKQSQEHFDKVAGHYKGYKLSTTGHSLGGAIAEHINTNNEGRVYDSITYSRGTGPADVLRKKSNSVYDVSNRYDPISMFARLGNKLSGTKQSIDTKFKFGQNHSLAKLKAV